MFCLQILLVAAVFFILDYSGCRPPEKSLQPEFYTTKSSEPFEAGSFVPATKVKGWLSYLDSTEATLRPPVKNKVTTVPQKDQVATTDSVDTLTDSCKSGFYLGSLVDSLVHIDATVHLNDAGIPDSFNIHYKLQLPIERDCTVVHDGNVYCNHPSKLLLINPSYNGSRIGIGAGFLKLGRSMAYGFSIDPILNTYQGQLGIILK